jgi:flavin-binding protein dodecin
MNDTGAASRPYSGRIRTKYAAAAIEEHPARIEFVGASDDTIAEAVRRALASASASLRTLEGVGVLVIPQVYREGPAPRYRVTLQVTAPHTTSTSAQPLPTPRPHE